MTIYLEQGYDRKEHRGLNSIKIYSKDRYNAKAYDEIKVRVPKRDKEKIKVHSANAGESVNGYIKTAIDQRIERASKGK
ncbi:MAG: hypothetical protein VZR27_12430 [Acutalibacteraceae bacterium]|nr:hypothetical protein [Acutalibacteraceae bacterium]